MTSQLPPGGKFPLLEWVEDPKRPGVKYPLGPECPRCPGRRIYCEARHVRACPLGLRMVDAMDAWLADEVDEDCPCVNCRAAFTTERRKELIERLLDISEVR